MTTSRVQLTGIVESPVPPERAFMMFTATGERTWARLGSEIPKSGGG